MSDEVDKRSPSDRPPPFKCGSFAEAERLRKWSFLQRTPKQRLEWLVAVLRIAYQTGALKPRRPP